MMRCISAVPEVTWELVFRPGDFEGSHVLMSLGGNSGGALGVTAITLIGSILDFRFQDANNEAQRVSVSTDLSLMGPATDFYHVVAVADVDTANTGTGTLYVNGVPVAGPTTSTGTINDWLDGGSARFGIGTSVPGATPLYADQLVGDIAELNYFQGRALDASVIEDRYVKISGNAQEFKITEILPDLDRGTVSLTWPSRAGRSYTVEYSSDLEQWIELDDSYLSQGDTTTYIDESLPVPIPRTRYYRVRQEN